MSVDPHIERIADVLVELLVRETKKGERPADTRPSPDVLSKKRIKDDDDYTTRPQTPAPPV